MKKIKEISVSPPEAAMTPKIDFEEINKVIKLLEDRNLAEFELENEGFKIKLRKNAPASASPVAVSSSPVYVAANPVAAGIPAPAADFAPEVRGSLLLVTSPIVGTFYRAASPTSPPFVDVGDPVKKKQTLCIVEATKLMNEIECEWEGVVREIYVENGKPVEYGQKLFAISPSA
jgi:acetyl-CoA carboxylase biotin carboxyl carrier protein